MSEKYDLSAIFDEHVADEFVARGPPRRPAKIKAPFPVRSLLASLAKPTVGEGTPCCVF